MKKIMLTLVSVLMVTNVLANTASSNFGKASNQLKSLGSAFKSHSTVTPKIDSNDITMGYAGQDIANKPIIA